MKKELRKNTFPVSRRTNLSKMFFTILLRTRFGKDDIPVKSFLYDFFKNEIDKETEKKDNDKLKMIRNSDFYKFYNHSRDLETWRYVYRLEGQHHLIETLPKKMYRGRQKRNEVRRDVKVDVIRDEVYDYFLLAVLSKMRVSRRDIDANLKSIVYDFNSLRALKVPLDKIFRDEEIRSFIFSKKGSHTVNPFLLAVDRFYKTSYFLYKELKSNDIDYRKKVIALIEVRKMTDPYLKAILIFSSLFNKEYIKYYPPYDFEKTSKMEIEEKFNKLCGSDINNERKKIIKIHCEDYWKNVVKPLIEVKREYYDFIEALMKKDIIEATDVVDGYEDYWFEGDEMYDKLDMSFPADEEDVKEKREILEKIKKKYGF
jgi:hypothetical protein